MGISVLEVWCCEDHTMLMESIGRRDSFDNLFDSYIDLSIGYNVTDTCFRMLCAVNLRHGRITPPELDQGPTRCFITADTPPSAISITFPLAYVAYCRCYMCGGGLIINSVKIECG